MSVMDPDPDDIFNEMVEGLSFSEPDAIDYTQLSDAELIRVRSEVHSDLMASGEMHNPNPTGTAAELHSQFAAIMAAIQGRRLTDT